jgi:hypothetical protein
VLPNLAWLSRIWQKEQLGVTWAAVDDLMALQHMNQRTTARRSSPETQRVIKTARVQAGIHRSDKVLEVVQDLAGQCYAMQHNSSNNSIQVFQLFVLARYLIDVPKP